MKKLMAIFAHPDDEGAIGGTLAHYAKAGHEVMLVCATRGEVGEISDPALATRETLGAVREKELEAACEILGIQHLRFLDYRDSGMAGTPENEDPASLVQANENEVIGKVIGLFNEFQPDVVITFEPFGWYGHPDHIAMGKWATAAFTQAMSSETDFKPDALYHAVIPFSKFKAAMEQAVAAGIIDEAPFANQIPEEEVKRAETAVTHIIPMSSNFQIKEDGMMAHKTQFGEDNMFRKMPMEMKAKMWSSEHFIQVFPEPTGTKPPDALNDLFAVDKS